jgi:hypothetical protein
MIRRSLVVAASLAAVGLSACQDRKAVAGACKPFPETAAAVADGPAAVEDCLHRWAYTLAGAADDAGTVADAVVAACGAPLSRWNQQALSAGAASGQLQEGPSLLTGEQTNPIAEHGNFAAGRALFYVVQARAGACKAPPRRSETTALTGPET